MKQPEKSATQSPTREAQEKALGPSEQATEITIAFDDNRFASLLFGHYDQNIARIERRLGVSAHANGNHVTIKGIADACDHARRVLEALYLRVKQGQTISLGDVDGAVQEGAFQGNLFPKDEIGRTSFDQVNTRKRGPVRARNAAQDVYLRALKRFELVFAEGPAGTGKTWLAVGHAVSLLEQGAVERLILSRPAVEAGERLGFLPGDMREKVDPYLRPLYDALYEMLGFERVAKLIERNVIEVAPLAFMRGRTLNDSFIILDEAQNTTVEQIKMFLTRVGFGSKAVVTGDITQIDLPRNKESGLRHVLDVLREVEGISFTFFGSHDVVRHPLVQRIVAAYEAYDLRNPRDEYAR